MHLYTHTHKTHVDGAKFSLYISYLSQDAFIIKYYLSLAYRKLHELPLKYVTDRYSIVGISLKYGPREIIKTTIS